MNSPDMRVHIFQYFLSGNNTNDNCLFKIVQNFIKVKSIQTAYDSQVNIVCRVTQAKTYWTS